jgi:hypothetical protein
LIGAKLGSAAGRRIGLKSIIYGLQGEPFKSASVKTASNGIQKTQFGQRQHTRNQIPSGSLHTNFWLLFFFKVPTKHTFFGKIFALIGRFGVPVNFLGFWVEPANSVG